MKVKYLIAPIKESIHYVIYYIRCNLFAFMCGVQALLPIIALWVGFNINKGSLLDCVVVILIIQLIISYIKKLMEIFGKGNDVPIPKERFTDVDNDGEVNIRKDRLQEMILYVCDVEDYLTRKGKL